MVCYPHLLSLVWHIDRYVWVGVVVVHLNKPSSCHIARGVIVLLGDIDTVFVDADILCQEIQALILGVEIKLDGAAVRSPCQAHTP